MYNQLRLSRYMNISDEWESPEKQPFKDFVSFPYNYSCVIWTQQNPSIITNIALLCVSFRVICATGWRILIVVISTV